MDAPKPFKGKSPEEDLSAAMKSLSLARIEGDPSQARTAGNDKTSHGSNPPEEAGSKSQSKSSKKKRKKSKMSSSHASSGAEADDSTFKSSGTKSSKSSNSFEEFSAKYTEMMLEMTPERARSAWKDVFEDMFLRIGAEFQVNPKLQDLKYVKRGIAELHKGNKQVLMAFSIVFDNNKSMKSNFFKKKMKEALRPKEDPSRPKHSHSTASGGTPESKSASKSAKVPKPRVPTTPTNSPTMKPTPPPSKSEPTSSVLGLIARITKSPSIVEPMAYVNIKRGAAVETPQDANSSASDSQPESKPED